MPGRGHVPGGCAAMEDGAEGSMEVVRVEAVVGASGGGSHGGWSRGSMEDGGAFAVVEKGVITVDPEKGVVVVVEEGGGRAHASSCPTSSLPASSRCCR
jgi:hypothetical protein